MKDNIMRLSTQLAGFIVLIGISAVAVAQPKPKATVVKRSVTHNLTDAQLAKFAGSMYWDKSVKAALSPALRTLLGDKWASFDKAFNKTTPLRYENGALVGSGFFGPSSSAIEFRNGGAVAAAFKEEASCTDFGIVNPGYLCDDLE